MNFSVIIPMFNAEDTIKNTIESVINQVYINKIEIIIINDGSNDKSESIINELIIRNKSNRSIKLINKLNGGVSSARNIGIREAKGKYLAFLDSDDIWHPLKLEIMTKILESKSINFIGHSFTLEDNSKKFYKLSNPVKISFLKLLIINFAVTPSIVIKKDICDFFDENMSHTEDHELWLRIALNQQVYYIDLPLVKLNRIQLSPGGLSSDRWSMRKGEIQMYRNIIRYRKSLIPFFPLLVLFSLLKHLRHIIKDSIKGEQ